MIKINSLSGGCVNYKSVAPGTDTICLKVCDTFGFCDTTQLVVTVLEKNLTGLKIRLVDSVFIDSVKQRCDVLLPQGTLTTPVTLTLNTTSNASFVYNSNTQCIVFRGLSKGVDSVGIRVCNTNNICDTTYLVVRVIEKVILKGKRYVYQDSVQIDSTKKVCLNRPQNTTTISKFNNFCSGNNKGKVTFTPDVIRQCVLYSGAKAGLDTACFELCNDAGICDTAYFYITATSPKVNPVDTNVLKPRTDTVKIKINQSLAYCPDSSRLRNAPITNIAYCDLSNYNNVDIALDAVKKCIRLKGKVVGTDTFCLVLRNQAGFADTTKLFVIVFPDTLKTRIRYDSVKVFVGDSTNYCYTDSTFLGGKIDTLYNSCGLRSGISSQVSKSSQLCFSVQGLFPGTDTLCVRACSNLTGYCDSIVVGITVIAKVRPKATRTDSVKVNVFGTTTYCFDTLSAQSSVTLCNNQVATYASRSVEGKCIKLTGKSAGVETVCVLTCSPFGVCDTTLLRVSVSPDTAKGGTHTQKITLKIGSDTLICLDTAIIRTAVDTFFDNCTGSNGLYARISPQRSTRCAQITGVKTGIDTACYVICNARRTVCDTTIIIVQVIDTGKVNLIAFDDFDTTRLSRTKDISVYVNDTLGGKIPSALTIVTDPKKGTAIVISITQGIIKFETSASPAACGIDSFRYRVCEGVVCSEATVTISIQCSDSLLVYNAISPNGDGVNDVFVIEGLQNYPDNTLFVYNRWGNEVLNSKNYQNDWDGKWNNKDLTDGTYFYQIYDNAKNILLKSGYISLFR